MGCEHDGTAERDPDRRPLGARARPEQERVDARRDAEQAWRQAMPRSLRPVWKSLLVRLGEDGDGARSAEAAELLTDATRALRQELGPDDAVASRLLAWHAMARWDREGDQARATRELLRRLPHTALLAALARDPTPEQICSAGRFLDALGDAIPSKRDGADPRRRKRMKAALRALREQVLEVCPAVREHLRLRA